MGGGGKQTRYTVKIKNNDYNGYNDHGYNEIKFTYNEQIIAEILVVKNLLRDCNFSELWLLLTFFF